MEGASDPVSVGVGVPSDSQSHLEQGTPQMHVQSGASHGVYGLDKSPAQEGLGPPEAKKKKPRQEQGQEGFGVCPVFTVIFLVCVLAPWVGICFFGRCFSSAAPVATADQVKPLRSAEFGGGRYGLFGAPCTAQPGWTEVKDSAECEAARGKMGRKANHVFSDVSVFGCQTGTDLVICKDKLFVDAAQGAGAPAKQEATSAAPKVVACGLSFGVALVVCVVGAVSGGGPCGDAARGQTDAGVHRAPELPAPAPDGTQGGDNDTGGGGTDTRDAGTGTRDGAIGIGTGGGKFLTGAS